MGSQKISIVLSARTVHDAKDLAAARGVSMSRLLAAIIEAGIAELRQESGHPPEKPPDRVLEAAAR